MGKATDDYTPEQRVAMAERARLLKSPRRQAEKDLMRQIGEKLRKVEGTAKAARATPKTRKQGGGHKPKFTAKQHQWLQKRYSRDMKAKTRLAKHDGTVTHVKDLAKTKFKIDAERDTLLDQIIRPVLLAYSSMEK